MYDLHKRSLERLNFKRSNNILQNPNRDDKGSSLMRDFSIEKENKLEKIAHRMVSTRHSDTTNPFSKRKKLNTEKSFESFV